MKRKVEQTDVGVLVGRFQVHELHPGHIELIQSVIDEHAKVIILLGLSPVKGTKNNPLDFEARKQMILERFPNVNLVYIADKKSNEMWSKDLDEIIVNLTNPGQTVTLYGGRDSFIKHYSGTYRTQELLQTTFESGTAVRKRLKNIVAKTSDFRHGVVWQANNQYPKPETTVDIAIYDKKNERFLMGKKPREDQWRFAGGFAHPDSDCYEDDAIRETKEETDLDVKDLKYIGSAKINDWRYASETNKIKSIFYITEYESGKPEAGDDLEKVKWMTLKELTKENIVDTHHVLVDMLIKYLI